MQAPLSINELVIQKFYARDDAGKAKPDPVLVKLEAAMRQARTGAEQLVRSSRSADQ